MSALVMLVSSIIVAVLFVMVIYLPPTELGFGVAVVATIVALLLPDFVPLLDEMIMATMAVAKLKAARANRRRKEEILDIRRKANQSPEVKQAKANYMARMNQQPMMPPASNPRINRELGKPVEDIWQDSRQ